MVGHTHDGPSQKQSRTAVSTGRPQQQVNSARRLHGAWLLPATAGNAGNAGVSSMIDDPFFSPTEPASEDALPEPPSLREIWLSRLRPYRMVGLRVLLFVGGIVAAFLSILLYQAVTPAPHILTTSDVNTSIAEA